VTYQYNANLTLWRVTDVGGGVTEYTCCARQLMIGRVRVKSGSTCPPEGVDTRSPMGTRSDVAQETRPFRG